MLNKKELKRFFAAVDILDQYFDYNRFDTDILDKVIELNQQNNLEGINILLNKSKVSSSDELLEELFNITFKEINDESHKLGYSKIY